MKKIKYNMQIGSTSTCMNIIMEAKKGVGQRDLKRYTKDYFLFDSQFSSKRSEETVMVVGADMIGMVRTNTKLFCKDTIYKMTNYWTGLFTSHWR